jgi:beta-phosphoglucomutase-like phosphatase (HAD superfamily)
MDIHAFLFDMDGTLVDTEVLYLNAIRRALADRHIIVDPSKVVSFVYGVPWPGVYQHIQTHYPTAFKNADDMLDTVNIHFLALREQVDIRIHSSIDLLIELSRHYPVAIVSGSMREELRKNIDIMKIEPHIQFYLGAEDYSPGKPHPAGYLLAAQRLELAPKQIVVFEDSTPGLRAASDAGMVCVGLQREGKPKQDMSLADLVLSDLVHFHNHFPFNNKSG